MGTEQSVRRRLTWLASLAAAGIVAGFVLGRTELGTSLYDHIRKKWHTFSWDYLQKGRIDWDGLVLSVPPGQYGWVYHDNGDLFIFSRVSQGHVSLLLRKGQSANFPYQHYIDATCVKRNVCAKLEKSVTAIGGHKAELISYRDEAPGIRIRSNAFIHIVEPAYLASVGAELEAEHPAAVKFGTEMLEQLTAQVKR